MIHHKYRNIFNPEKNTIFFFIFSVYLYFLFTLYFCCFFSRCPIISYFNGFTILDMSDFRLMLNFVIFRDFLLRFCLFLFFLSFHNLFSLFYSCCCWLVEVVLACPSALISACSIVVIDVDVGDVVVGCGCFTCIVAAEAIVVIIYINNIS